MYFWHHTYVNQITGGKWNACAGIHYLTNSETLYGDLLLVLKPILGAGITADEDLQVLPS